MIWLTAQPRKPDDDWAEPLEDAFQVPAAFPSLLLEVLPSLTAKALHDFKNQTAIYIVNFYLFFNIVFTLPFFCYAYFLFLSFFLFSPCIYGFVFRETSMSQVARKINIPKTSRTPCRFCAKDSNWYSR